MGISQIFDYSKCKVTYIVINSAGDLSISRKTKKSVKWGYVAINEPSIKERVGSLNVGQKKALCADIYAHLHMVGASNWDDIDKEANGYLEYRFDFK